MAMANVALLFLMLVAPAVHAVEHVVGNSAGWTLNQNYQTWAANKTFVVGDTLVFRYDNSHSVDIVDREDYNECDTGDAIRRFGGGNTTIPLQVPGPMYFICPVPGHCLAGMKLEINVQAAPAVHAVEHVVGNNAGWTLNQNYQIWAANKTFVVGDTLVFRYDNSHSVDIVDRDDYNECDTGDAIRRFSGGNTTITLQVPGPMYFICPVPGHCLAGMKLAINVQAASGTPGRSPPPATPTTPPASAPGRSATPITPSASAPGGSSTPTTPSGSTPGPTSPGSAPAVRAVEHVVGNNAGWTLNQNYQTWATNKTFAVGDTLVFRYDNSHSVDIVDRDDYNECDTGDAIRRFTGGNTTIPLQVPGPMYFICPVPGHCLAGMKLAINVQVASGTPGRSPPPATPTIPPASAPGGSPTIPPTTPSASAPSGSSTPITPSGSTPGPTSPGIDATTPTPSGGVRIFGEVKNLMLVASIVVAAMLV